VAALVGCLRQRGPRPSSLAALDAPLPDGTANGHVIITSRHVTLPDALLSSGCIVEAATELEKPDAGLLFLNTSMRAVRKGMLNRCLRLPATHARYLICHCSCILVETNPPLKVEMLRAACEPPPPPPSTSDSAWLKAWQVRRTT